MYELRPLLLAFVLALCAASQPIPLAAQEPGGSGSGSQKSPKLIILGFDGADAKLTRAVDGRGQAAQPGQAASRRAPSRPCARRSRRRRRSPGRPSRPACTPGRHGVFDFLKRDPQTYQPGLRRLRGVHGALPARARTTAGCSGDRRRPGPRPAGLPAAQAVPAAHPRRRGRRRAGRGCRGRRSARASRRHRCCRSSGRSPSTASRATPSGSSLGKAGKRVRVMRIPVTFPPKAYEHGELLTGLGTPGPLAAASASRSTSPPSCSSSPRAAATSRSRWWSWSTTRGSIDTEIKGPPEQAVPQEGGARLHHDPHDAHRARRPQVARHPGLGQDLTLKAGEWSDWVRFTFPFNPLIKVHGIGSFRLMSIEPEMRLYLSPIQFDPEHLPPVLDITTPPELRRRPDRRATACSRPSAGRSTPGRSTTARSTKTVFLEDVELTVDKEREMLRRLPRAQDDWDVLVHYFEFTDRVQHMMFRFLDPKHPLYTAEGAAKWGGSILAGLPGHGRDRRRDACRRCRRAPR